MTWVEWMAARQLLAEETVGVAVRQTAAQEDAAFSRATKNLQRIK
jgi:hypothetical protein